ncbi:myrosinase 1-like [Microplitis mediator]|uniref:myrosinase 1-like n=1 Tax=Microplitis mediator TaxID=375433 RepID=UPI002554A221|nr:myrosinase 1-like [Microplitis mediator]
MNFIILTLIFSTIRGDDHSSISFLARKLVTNRSENVKVDKFPDDFIFGVGTSAYQSEGAWNVSNKGESIWDKMTHEQPSTVADGTNADVAANSYYLYKTDVDLVKQLGANSYRISLSWPRILPTGFDNYVNEDGIRYYNDLIDEMLKKNITPFVTIFHWDLPLDLEDLGGWTNPSIVDWFVDYARVVFNAFGAKVKYWTTFNEPMFYCMYGYQGILAPRKNWSGIADYLCGHNALLAHAKTYRLYSDHFRKTQKGKISLNLALFWTVPENPNDQEEVDAADYMFEFRNEWFLHPIYSKDGDYSKIMKDRIANYSSIQGLFRSRLPAFKRHEIELIKNSADFLSINYYSVVTVRKFKNFDIKETISYDADVGTRHTPGAPNNASFETENNECDVKNCQPWGLSKIIKRLTQKYSIPMIMIAENGYADEGQLEDMDRAKYFYYHLKEILKLIKEGINIQGYYAWTLFDVFEWDKGHTFKLGLYSVNYTDPERARTPRKWSPKLLKDIYTTKTIPSSFLSFVNENKNI